MSGVLDTFNPVTGERGWIGGKSVRGFKVGDRVRDSVSGWTGVITLIGSSYYEGGLIQVEFENNKFIFVHVSQLTHVPDEAEKPTAKFNPGDRVYAKVDPDDQGTVVGKSESGFYEVGFDLDGVCFMPEKELVLVRVGTVDDLAESVRKFATSKPVVSKEQIEEIATLGEQLGISSFEQSVRRHTDRIANLLIEKNKQYSNSALDPIRVFSKADRTEQLRVRADDKLSRIRNGDTSEDALTDLAGYIILMKIAEESA